MLPIYESLTMTGDAYRRFSHTILRRSSPGAQGGIVEPLARLDGNRPDVMNRRIHRACLPALALASLAGLAAPAHANSAAVEYFRSRADRTAVPTLLSQEDRTYYTQLFAAIERQDWTNVQSMLASAAMARSTPWPARNTISPPLPPRPISPR
jgi:hypothetical protein